MLPLPGPIPDMPARSRTPVPVWARALGPWLAVLVLWSGAILWFGHTQKPVSHNQGMGWDGAKYNHLRAEALRGEPLAEDKPYAYRLATPWLAAQLPVQDARLAFHIINQAAVLTTGLLLLAIMRTLGAGSGISLFLIATFFLQWHAPLRQQFYDSFCVDAPAQVFACLIVLAHLRVRMRARRIAWLSLAAFAGAFFRESVLFAAFAVWAADLIAAGRGLPPGKFRPWLDRDRWIDAIPMAAGLAGVLGTHALAKGAGSYSMILTLFFYLYHKPPVVLIHAFFNGYGTALIPVLVFWRRAWAHIKAAPILGLYPLITFLLGWTAGEDTTRINYWGCVGLLPLMALVLSELRIGTFAIGSWLALEAVTTRMFFPIPDFPGSSDWQIPWLINWGAGIPVFDLWSESANAKVLLISLFQYLALTAAAFAWIRFRGRERYLRTAPCAEADGTREKGGMGTEGGGHGG
jgi:hypothetical protein